MRAILPHPRSRRGEVGHRPGIRERPPLRTTPMTSRLLHAWFGVLATLVGVAAGHLVAAFTEPSASPVLAVGSTVIDLTPTPLKEWAIAHFGSNDKTVLVGSVMVVVLLLAAVAGLLARRRLAYGAALLVVLVAVAAVAALTRPTAGLVDVVPSVVTALAGVGALTWLVTGSRPGDTARPGDEAPGASRRAVLVASGTLAVAAAAMGAAGRWLGSYRTRPEDVALPAPADPARAFPDGLDRPGPGHHAVPHPDRRLLPGRHPAHGAGGRPRRLAPDHRRRRRPRGHPHLRRPARDGPDRARHHADLRLQRGGRALRRRRPLARRPPHRPARPGRHRPHEGRPDPLHRRRRHDDQHAAGRGHRRPRRDDRDRHERRGRCPASTASRPGWSSPASTASSAPPSGSPG